MDRRLREAAILSAVKKRARQFVSAALEYSREERGPWQEGWGLS